MALSASLLVGGIAEEMANYYTDVFPDGVIDDLFKTAGPDGQEMVVTASIRLNETPFLIINGPQHTPNESNSFVINCKDQAEVDHYWNRFVGDGGEEGDCGWCKDKFGFSWQVVPVQMPQLFGDPDPERGRKAFEAMMTMKKIDLAAIKAAMDS